MIRTMVRIFKMLGGARRKELGGRNGNAEGASWSIVEQRGRRSNKEESIEEGATRRKK